MSVFEPLSVWSLMEILFSAIEVYMVYRLYTGSLSIRNGHKRWAVLGAFILLIYIIILNNIIFVNGQFMTFLSLCGTSAYCILLFDSPLYEKAFYSILPTGIVLASDFLTFSLSVTLNFFHPAHAWMPSAERFLMTSIYTATAVVLYIIVMKILKRFQEINLFSRAMRIFITILLVMGILVINFLIQIVSESHSLRDDLINLDIYVIYIGVVFLIMLISIVFFLKKWGALLHKSKQEELQLQYKRMKDDYYKNIEETSKRLDYFRHDFKKHLDVMHILLDGGKVRQAEEYLATLNDIYQKGIDISDYTNNDVLNAILTRKKYLCNKHDINLRLMIEEIEKYPFSPYEICVIFDNLLENAMEACLRLEQDQERFIDLFLTQDNNCIYITIKNSYIKKLIFNKGKLQSSKKTAGHGFGLEILYDAIQKVNGKIKYETNEEDGIFITVISIPKNL